MIDLYTWSTPNGFKISVLLEELEVPYTVHPIDITKGEQFTTEFLALNPNNKIPTIVDHDGPDGQPITIIESGAILLYLAEKTGKLMPTDHRGRMEVIQWLMLQKSSIGPMLGQNHHFRHYTPDPIDYAIDRYTKEARRLYSVLDRRLGDVPYLAGDYSIADVATFPWIRPWKRQGQDLNAHPNLKRWFEAIAARPAVERGLAVPPQKMDLNRGMDAETRSNLFGAVQFTQR